jgi:hypothetical protein
MGETTEMLRRAQHDSRAEGKRLDTYTTGIQPYNAERNGTAIHPDIRCRGGARPYRADGLWVSKCGHEADFRKKVKLQNEPKFDQAGMEKCGKRTQKRTQVSGSVMCSMGHGKAAFTTKITKGEPQIRLR